MAIKRRVCSSCSLGATKLHRVFAVGAIPSRIVFFTDGPNRDEDRRGRLLVGDEATFFFEMVVDAAKMAELPIPAYCVIPVVFCRPVDHCQGPTRPPTAEEVLKCAPGVDAFLHKAEPVYAVFFGSAAERFYGKRFKSKAKIIEPAFLMKQGGKRSAFYLSNVRRLSDVFKKVEEM